MFKYLITLISSIIICFSDSQFNHNWTSKLGIIAYANTPIKESDKIETIVCYIDTEYRLPSVSVYNTQQTHYDEVLTISNVNISVISFVVSNEQFQIIGSELFENIDVKEHLIYEIMDKVEFKRDTYNYTYSSLNAVLTSIDKEKESVLSHKFSFQVNICGTNYSDSRIQISATFKVNKFEEINAVSGEIFQKHSAIDDGIFFANFREKDINTFKNYWAKINKKEEIVNIKSAPKIPNKIYSSVNILIYVCLGLCAGILLGIGVYLLLKGKGEKSKFKKLKKKQNES